MILFWNKTSTPPQRDEHVLFYFEGGGLSPFEIGYYAGPDKWMCLRGDHCHEADCAPSHWTPLPEAPAATEECRCE